MRKAAGVLVAIGVAAAAPAFAQKMYRCTDASGSTVFQQGPCGETAQEAEARAREAQRVQAEAQRRKEEEQQRKEAAIQKAKERDRLYKEQMEAREAERRKAAEAERRIVQGAGRPSDKGGELPPSLAATYPGPWLEGGSNVISAALQKAKIQNCSDFTYRQRGGGGDGEYIVLCTTKAANGAHYFVWPRSQAVKGPVKF